MFRKKLEGKSPPFHAESFSKLWFSNFGRRFGMNATWIKSFALSAVACSLAGGTVAMAGPLGVTVDFSCADGQGIKSAGGNVCTAGVGPKSSTAISSWSQGFTSTSGPGAVNIAVSGNNSNATNTGGHNTGAAESVYWNPKQGDPTPPALSSGTHGTYTFNVTDSGDYLFQFVSIDLGMNTGGKSQEAFYYITGYNGATVEFTEDGEICKTGNTETCTSGIQYTWVDSTSGDVLTDLVITVVDPYGSIYADNLEVDEVPTPEPGSLFLLGTGLLGLAFVAFRKTRTTSLSFHS
jgi:hypothetical protein